MKRMSRVLAVVTALVIAMACICAAEVAKKTPPLYDGKPGQKIGDVFIDPQDGAEMAWVPADVLSIKDKVFSADDAAAGDSSAGVQPTMDVDILGVKGNKLSVTARLLGGSTARLSIWLPGSLHHWIGKLTYAKYTFDSDKDYPLVFRVDKDKGYVYVSGKGTVTMPDGKTVTLTESVLAKKLVDLALSDQDADIRRAAALRLTDQTALRKVVAESKDADVRAIALRKLDDTTAMAGVAKNDSAAVVRQAAADGAAAKTRKVNLGGDVQMELVLIEPGSFKMGSEIGLDDEKPVHEVHINQPFYMGKYEVTQEQWEKVMGSNPSTVKGPKNPVTDVNWDDCQLFLGKLNERIGRNEFSLPTEAQWEYACRAGSTSEYFWGDDPGALGEYAWRDHNSGDRPHPVGEKKPNAWGLYDMAGNVNEWCADWYDKEYYKHAPMLDPVSPAAGSLRVRRGGSYFCGYDSGLRCADRDVDDREYRSRFNGFRCAMLAEKAGGILADINDGPVLSSQTDNAVAKNGPLSGVKPVVRNAASSGTTGEIAKGAKKAPPINGGKPGTKIGDVCVNPKDGAEMVWVPAGEFIMGSTDEQTAAALREWRPVFEESAKFFSDAAKPQRNVHLDGYWMYKHEVTVAQYRKYCVATGRKMPDAPDWGWKDDHPMVMVTWEDAADYAKWAGVSLPTEAQWEKAARGTDGRTYPWGNNWDASMCAHSVSIAEPLKNPQPVGSHTSDASPYGCLDMMGNVREWCADWYDPNYYQNAPTKSPTGPAEAVEFRGPIIGEVVIEFSGARVLRGASWLFDLAYSFQSTYRRDYSAPASRGGYIGFRCARSCETNLVAGSGMTGEVAKEADKVIPPNDKKPGAKVVAAAQSTQTGAAEAQTATPPVSQFTNLELSSPPLSIKGIWMVPMRDILNWVGASVSHKNGQVSATMGEGDKLRKIAFAVGKTKGAINGEEVPLATPPILRSGVVYVPLRFIGEAVGAKVAPTTEEGAVVLSHGDRKASFILPSEPLPPAGGYDAILAFAKRHETLAQQAGKAGRNGIARRHYYTALCAVNEQMELETRDNPLWEWHNLMRFGVDNVMTGSGTAVEDAFTSFRLAGEKLSKARASRYAHLWKPLSRAERAVVFAEIDKPTGGKIPAATVEKCLARPIRLDALAKRLIQAVVSLKD